MEANQPSPGNTYSFEQKQSIKRHSSGTDRPSDIDVDLERSMKRFARYGQIYADSPLSYIPNVETSGKIKSFKFFFVNFPICLIL